MKSTVENNIIINNKTYTYVVTYKKIKNIYFRVKSDLKIYVTCNPRVSINRIESLLKNNYHSIMKMYLKELDKLSDKDTLYYLGNKLELVISNTKPYISNDIIYAKDLYSAKEYIYSLALNTFKTRLERILSSFDNLPNFKLKVRKMTSKWGVCNIRSMSITLNTYLIEKDVHLIDYVIVHELCHFHHMDHSPSFWKEVSLHYPYYKVARKELNY